MYHAHLSEDKTREQTILDHLQGTARLSGDFADHFNCREWGYGCGLIHDIGKYSERFQKRLHGGTIVDHATAGAQELYKRKNLAGAYCISGHHSGLLDGGTVGDSAGEATLQGRLKKTLDNYQAYESEITIPQFPVPPIRPFGRGGFSLSFFIRMIFSCLVDADFLDTESFMKMNSVQRGGYDSIDTLLEKLQLHVKSWLTNTDENTVNGRRTRILKSCFEQGNREQGLFQLTVPTGGGKTVSSLAFALTHAKHHHLSRIIYVIPYTSIIEQNAKIFQDILGKRNVLEDHCNVVYEDGEEFNVMQLAAENWDCPVVVTTNVQFFESLFSNKTSKCRKIHNISDSVIIFDEAQMLPVKYLRPCIRAISELIYNYHSTAVLCTATQPSLQKYFPEHINTVELCPDVKSQFEFFRRTEIRKIGEITEEQLAECLRGENQVLCILNSRKRVQRVYEALEGEGTYHLSTFMYPEHRKRLLKKIRDRLKEGKACRLIATSLVEAGVDFDFQTVYREMAGIDSVIQAAGRCNREDRRSKEDCSTVVFTLTQSEDIHLPPELKLPIAVAGQIAEMYEDLSAPEAIHEYFTRLYQYKGEGLDAKNIIDQFESASRSCLFPFQTVAEQFHLIENNTKTILIDKEPEAIEIVRRLKRKEHSRQLIRDAGRYCVNLYENDFNNLEGAGRLEKMDYDFYRLRNPEQYTEETGLKVDVSRGDAVLF